MIRKKKLYLRPRKLYQTQRIKEENELVKKYGLKNKTEIWKTLAKVNYFRHRAKALAYSSPDEQEVLFRKLKATGLSTNSISDVLGLQIESILKRRLPSVIVAKNLANTPQQARQMVVHKRVLINSKVVNAPSYLVKVNEENSITIKSGKPKTKPSEEHQNQTLEKNVEVVE